MLLQEFRGAEKSTGIMEKQTIILKSLHSNYQFKYIFKNKNFGIFFPLELIKEMHHRGNIFKGNPQRTAQGGSLQLNSGERKSLE